MGDHAKYRVVIDGGAVVERETRMAANGARTRVSMIPATFDLRAFDEMFRHRMRSCSAGRRGPRSSSSGR